jgi:AraC-like DNA-binding protein
MGELKPNNTMKPPSLSYDAIPYDDDAVILAEPDDQFYGESSTAAPSDDLCILASPSATGSHACGTTVVGQLASKGIVHLGIIDGNSAVERTVIGKHGQAMMICFNQPTRVRMADGWKRFGPRSACLLSSPVNIRTSPESGWVVAYICYTDPSGFPDLSGNPVNFDALPLVQAIRGLHAEAVTDSNPALLLHWVELIHGYVRIFAQPRQADERILKAWRKISEDLRRDWSVEEMAVTAMMCGEHFRRLCLKTFGRSPMMHLSLLRIQRAEELLRFTDQKIEAICDEIGYEYRSTFSNIFTKLVGMRPSVYRNATRALSGGIQAG